MNHVATELTDAYRREEELYLRVLQLVEEQNRAMKDDADLTAVFGLCSKVEDLLDEIAMIEENIQPAKEQWNERGEEPPEELECVLGRIQTLIQKTAGKQGKVQQWLARQLCSSNQVAESDPVGVNAGRVRRSYGSQ